LIIKLLVMVVFFVSCEMCNSFGLHEDGRKPLALNNVYKSAPRTDIANGVASMHGMAPLSTLL